MNDPSELLALALRHMTNGLVALDADAQVVLVNDRMQQLFGLAPGSIRIGTPLAELLALVGRSVGWDAQRVARVLANHRQWLAEGTARSFDHHYDDGTVLRIAFRPTPGNGGVLTYDDVTHERQLEMVADARRAQGDRFHDDVATAVTRVATAARTVRRTRDVIAEETGSVAARIADVLEIADRSGAALESMTQAAHAMTVSIGTVTQQADHAATATAEALTEVRRSDALFANLTQHAEAIGSILDVIGALARQSRLLALNATIEAARAGDAGHPFRVVAQEVKSLSNQIAAATVAVAERIDGVRSAVTEVVDANAHVHGRLDDIHGRADMIRVTAAGRLAHVDTVTALIGDLMRVTAGAHQRFGELAAGNRRLQGSLVDVTEQFGKVEQSVAALVAGADRFRTEQLGPARPPTPPLAPAPAALRATAA